MSEGRREKLQDEMNTLEDAILYAEDKGVSGLKEAKLLLDKAKNLFEQGTWSKAESELSKASSIISSDWYNEFIERREKEGGKLGERRFKEDGLCEKYGHLMVKVRISHVRWFYQCRVCGKRSKRQSIK